VKVLNIRLKYFSCSEQGFALPSVLFLVTILTFVSLSIISLQYFRRHISELAIARVKADYAAQSGITKAISALDAEENFPTGTTAFEKDFTFVDGSLAHTNITRWGLYILISSEGRFGQMKSLRTATAAALPIGVLEKALVFKSPNEQLVFSGESSIEGDILVGPAGVTTGTLPGIRTPKKIPVDGAIARQSNTSISAFDASLLYSEINQYKELLPRARSKGVNDLHAITIASGKDFSLRVKRIPDSIGTVIVNGDCVFTDSLTRRSSPLNVVFLGRLSIHSSACLSGLISIFALKEIELFGNPSISQVILFSPDSIQIGENVSYSAQLISPVITVQKNSFGRYPSVLCSYGLGDSLNQRITLEGGATLQGTVILLQDSKKANPNNTVILDPSAFITGLLYSEDKTTLDGKVIGMVITNDFFFYQAPTRYNGWLRGGTINRKSLPQGFLAPFGFSSMHRVKVLEWI
jgi:hypothetical protein